MDEIGDDIKSVGEEQDAEDQENPGARIACEKLYEYESDPAEERVPH